MDPPPAWECVDNRPPSAPPALAGPPATHTHTSHKVQNRYLKKKPQHNQASCEGPGGARFGPLGLRTGPGGLRKAPERPGSHFGSCPAEFAGCPLLLWRWGRRHPVHVATGQPLHVPRRRKGGPFGNVLCCLSKCFGGAPASGDAGNTAAPPKCLAVCPL